MGLQVPSVQNIGKIIKRWLRLLLKKYIGDPIVDDPDPGFVKPKKLLQVIFCGVGTGKNDSSFFSNLPHEKFPDLDPNGRLKKVGKLEVNQVVDRDKQPLRDKKRINIVRRKIIIIPELSGLKRDLHMLSNIIVSS
jgi:hypothetical protein